MFIVWLKDRDDHPKIKERFNATAEILKSTASQSNLEYVGCDLLTRSYRLVYFLDWVTFYLAILYKTNPTSIDKISRLKEILK